MNFKQVTEVAKSNKLEAKIPGLQAILDILVKIVEKNTATDNVSADAGSADKGQRGKGWLQNHNWFVKKILGFMLVGVKCPHTSFAFDCVVRGT